MELVNNKTYLIDLGHRGIRGQYLVSRNLFVLENGMLIDGNGVRNVFQDTLPDDDPILKLDNEYTICFVYDEFGSRRIRPAVWMNGHFSYYNEYEERCFNVNIGDVVCIDTYEWRKENE